MTEDQFWGRSLPPAGASATETIGGRTFKVGATYAPSPDSPVVVPMTLLGRSKVIAGRLAIRFGDVETDIVPSTWARWAGEEAA